MDSQQQKINYLYDREKKREFDECVEMESEMEKEEELLRYHQENKEGLGRLSKTFLAIFIMRTEVKDRIEKKCKIKVYGKQDTVDNDFGSVCSDTCEELNIENIKKNYAIFLKQEKKRRKEISRMRKIYVGKQKTN